MIRSFEEAKLDQIFFRQKHNFTRRELAELIWLVSEQNITEFLETVPAERQHQVRFEELLESPEAVLRGVCDFLGIDFVPAMLEPYESREKRMTNGLHAESRMLGDVKFHGHDRIDAGVGQRWKQQVGRDKLGDETWATAERLGYSKAEAEPAASVESAPKPAARRGASVWSPLVEIQSGAQGRRPLFFVHPVGGNVYCYVDLARRLGVEQPFYGLQARGLGEHHVPLRLVSDMACYYVEALRAAQPSGPYMLGGWSMGGVVAYEMARQMRERGDEIELLALVDSHVPVAGGRPRAENPRSLLYTFALDLGLSTDDLDVSSDANPSPEFYEQQLARILDVATSRGKLPPGVDLSQIQRLFDVFKINSQAVDSYRPERTPSRVALFRAEEKLNATEQQLQTGASWPRLLRQLRIKREDPTLGWGKLAAGGVDVRTVPGNHFSLMRQPHVNVLAEELRAYILKTHE
jgi:thioesterase domain-containing protein